MVKYISANLRVRGYDVLTAADGRAALKLFAENPFDLVVLDVMMPGPDGLEVCKAIRRQSDVPVIMLSALGEERDVVRALDLGADDYLTKPFGVEEMLARVDATLRRSTQTGSTPRPPLIRKDLVIDFAARRVTIGGELVVLTPTEHSLLTYLALNAGRVLTYRRILESVWGPEYGDEKDYVWAYIRRLRRKIEPDPRDPRDPRYILTWPGVGYSFAGDT